MRERLIELLNARQDKGQKWSYYENGQAVETVSNSTIADHLLANGVIVPPCKVGDKLYIIAAVSGEIVECVVKGMWLFEQSFSLITDSGTIINSSFGKTVFLSREEAEKALNNIENGNS